MAMTLLASFANFGGPDLIVILLIVLVLFGAKKLPELAKGMGQAVREFNKAKEEFGQEIKQAGTTAASNQTAPPVTPAQALPEARTIPAATERTTPVPPRDERA